MYERCEVGDDSSGDYPPINDGLMEDDKDENEDENEEKDSEDLIENEKESGKETDFEDLVDIPKDKAEIDKMEEDDSDIKIPNMDGEMDIGDDLEKLQKFDDLENLK